MVELGEYCEHMEDEHKEKPRHTVLVVRGINWRVRHYPKNLRIRF